MPMKHMTLSHVKYYWPTSLKTAKHFSAHEWFARGPQTLQSKGRGVHGISWVRYNFIYLQTQRFKTRTQTSRCYRPQHR